MQHLRKGDRISEDISLLKTFICSRLLEVRARLYELLTHCIPPDIIMKVPLTSSVKVLKRFAGMFEIKEC